MKTTLGIDVYQLPLSPEQGYCAAGKGNIRLLVIKSELEDWVKEHAISEFLGIKQFQISRSNVTANKIYAGKAEDFKQRIRVPEQLLDEMYNSKYARFFYSGEELAAFRLRWSGGRGIS